MSILEFPPRVGVGRPELGRPLSVREKQLLDLVSRGESCKTAAVRMGIAHGTARCQSRAIRRKLGAETAAHAVRLGFERGDLELDGVARAA